MQRNNAMFGRQANPHAAPRHAPPPHSQGPPVGTFAPGTKIQVGSHRVMIEKYLSEGGFAHVYLVKLPKPIDGTDIAVLKRVAVPDKDSLRNMRTEVETMKRLKGHRPIVTYIDSHASEIKSGGYEVFLLMEYCNGGGLIDFMNTRLQHRLTEPEILKIITDIAEGVACMHYLKPPLLHRDLKVENVLITRRSSGKRFKLCDFGSAASPTPAPTTAAECRQMDEDVQKHTTLQYRSPEMIDVYRKQPLNEKSDIWALGVLLYKLCYYTTPFEEQGSLAIMNASYRFPHHPVFSGRLQKLIASTLRENMEERPNIYQFLKEACAMQHIDIPIQDIYSCRNRSSDTTKPQEHQPKKQSTAGSVGASVSTPVEKKHVLPDITPMRRGRLPASDSKPKMMSQPNLATQVTDGDPFAALDSKPLRRPNHDELSSRFPSINEFSLMHDKESKFNFDTPVSSVSKPAKEPKAQVTEKLADAAFNTGRSAQLAKQTVTQKATPPKPLQKLSTSDFPGTPAEKTLQEPQQPRTASNYVSTGTMTSDDRLCKVDSKNTSTSQSLPRPHPSMHSTVSSGANLISFSPTVANKKSATHKQSVDNDQLRPASTTLGLGLDNESRDQGLSISPQDGKASEQLTAKLSDTSKEPLSETKEWKKKAYTLPQSQARRLSYRDIQASSGTSKLKDAFEQPGRDDEGKDWQHRSQSPRKSAAEHISRPSSVAPPADDMVNMAEDDMTPEIRREMERVQLEEEEKRVAAAQAEYRNRVARGSSAAAVSNGFKPHLPVKSSAIQQRMQAYLNDDHRQSTVPRTAEGYGKYTDAAAAAGKPQKLPPEISHKPLLATSSSIQSNEVPQRSMSSHVGTVKTSKATDGSVISKPPVKPPPPKKPVHLNHLSSGTRQPSTERHSKTDGQHLIALDLPGRPEIDMSLKERDEYLENFDRRFPSLSSMEASGH